MTTDLSLMEVIRSTAAPRSTVLASTLALEESLAGRRLARDAIRLAQLVSIKESDPELMLLMLCTWAELDCRIGRPTDAETILHQARALLNTKTHPEIVARLTEAESILADTQGDRGRQEKLLALAMESLPPFSPRRKLYVWRHAMMLALQARGVETESNLKDLLWQCNAQFKISRVFLTQFVGAVEAGQVNEANLLLPQAEAAAGLLRDMSRLSFKGYATLLALLQNQPTSGAPAGIGPGEELVRVAALLLAANTAEALKTARVEADRMGVLFGTGFAAFNLVRAELAAGNGVAAGRLLRMRQSRGNHHALDDFFLARAERLGGNGRAAARLFASALRSVDRCRARGRLDFELKLACEMSPADIVQLTRTADEVKVEVAVGPAEETRSGAGDKVRRTPALVMGRSNEMLEVRRAIRRFADLDAPVLITGETGVGKDLVARALHESSRRAAEPFTPVNCGSIAETLLESELFGHEKGAFTGAEHANEGLFSATGRGTIFLDEIGDVSPRLQGALLRVMETGEIRAVGSTRTRQIRCRILAATNANLPAMAEEGRFRRDLLFRLQRLELPIPPLRDRRDDILLLARHFLDQGRPIGVHADIAPALRAKIRAYDWPGNVRELRNVIERVRLMHSDKLAYGEADINLKFHSIPAEVDPTPVTPVSEARHGTAAAAAAATDAVPETTRPAPTAPGGPPAPAATTDVSAWLRQGTSPLRREERLRGLFREHPRLTRAEIMCLMAISANTATKYLQALCRAGVVRRVQPSASTRSHYFESVVEGEEGGRGRGNGGGWRGGALQNLKAEI